jgi:hypothetical protein
LPIVHHVSVLIILNIAQVENPVRTVTLTIATMRGETLGVYRCTDQAFWLRIYQHVKGTLGCRLCDLRLIVGGELVSPAARVLHTCLGGVDNTHVVAIQQDRVCGECQRLVAYERDGVKTQHVSAPPGSSTLSRTNRSAQWMYWTRGQDQWDQTAQLVQSNMNSAFGDNAR